MLFVSIIWNYFGKIPVEICQSLNNLSPIRSITVLHLGSHFRKFIEDVYSFNKIKQEYISKKVMDLETLPYRDVLIIHHELSEPELVYDSKEHSFFSMKSRFLKDEIRARFNQAFNCIDNAPIIHSTDNERETLELTKTLRDYYKVCPSETLNENIWNLI